MSRPTCIGFYEPSDEAFKSALETYKSSLSNSMRMVALSQDLTINSLSSMASRISMELLLFKTDNGRYQGVLEKLMLIYNLRGVCFVVDREPWSLGKRNLYSGSNPRIFKVIVTSEEDLKAAVAKAPGEFADSVWTGTYVFENGKFLPWILRR